MHKKLYGCNKCPYLINIAKITQNLSLIKCALRVHVRVYQIHKKNCSETFQPLVQMQLTKRRKNSIFTFVIRLGGVAQLVERLNGIQEVRGSTPLISTKRRSPMNTGLQAHRTFIFITQNHPLTQALTQILFVPERLWILFCFWLSITRQGQSLSFCGRRERLP